MIAFVHLVFSRICNNSSTFLTKCSAKDHKNAKIPGMEILRAQPILSTLKAAIADAIPALALVGTMLF